MLLLIDSWGGHSGTAFTEYLAREGIQTLQIPKHTTGRLQPLDLNFFRQYKKFVKRITEEAIYQNLVANVRSREGIINMHGIIWNQFSSPRYRDMIRYAWHGADLSYTHGELTNGAPPEMVSDIQFDIVRRTTCSRRNCGNPAFMKCSHCGKVLCLQRFLERKCFHRGDSNSTNQPTATTPRPSTTTRDPNGRDWSVIADKLSQRRAENCY